VGPGHGFAAIGNGEAALRFLGEHLEPIRTVWRVILRMLLAEQAGKSAGPDTVLGLADVRSGEFPAVARFAFAPVAELP
jgi:hypothetical protein